MRNGRKIVRQHWQLNADIYAARRDWGQSWHAIGVRYGLSGPNACARARTAAKHGGLPWPVVIDIGAAILKSLEDDGTLVLHA